MPGFRQDPTCTAAPRISVVAPFHNRAAMLPAMLSSLRQQSCQDFELIIVDDGSTDGLEECIKKTTAPYAIRFIRLPTNRGAAAARNAGIDAASGHYVALLDSDDAWHPEKLRLQLAHLDAGPPQMVSLTRQKIIGAGGHVAPRTLMTRHDDVGSYLFLRGGVIQSSMMMLPRGLARDVRFEDGSRGHDDWSFALRLQQRGACFEMLAQPLTLYNDAGNRPRRSPAYSMARLEWLARRRAQLGDRGYWAAVAAVASHLRGGHAYPAKLIATAYRNGAISLAKAAYYLLALSFPPARSLARQVKRLTGPQV